MADDWRACLQCSADVDECDCDRGHFPWFARLRDRLSRRRDGDANGRGGTVEFGSTPGAGVER